MEILKNRRLTIAIVTLALCVAHQTRAINAYLKETGPSPLRFSLAAAVPASLALPDSLVERSTATNTTEVASPSTPSAETNAVAAQQSSASVVPGNAAIQTTTDPQNSSSPTPSASDMLVVSPQMLTEFFKPVGGGTNSSGTVIVPVPVGFTPPSATPSSRATYHSP
jgi:hypothetical protein